MIKAYFFDWMGTLGFHENSEDIGEIISKEEKELLMTHKLKDVISDKNRRKSVQSLISEDEHFLYADSWGVVNYLKNKNYYVSIVSNMYGLTTKKIRKDFSEFLSKFDVVSLSAEVGFKKPQSEIFISTLEQLNKKHKLNILPEEVMMIGDRQDKDIEPALKLGMQARLINRNKNTLRGII